MKRSIFSILGTGKQAHMTGASPCGHPAAPQATRLRAYPGAWLVLSLLFFASCEQVIDIDLPPHTPQIVVTSTFSPDSLIWVTLGASKSLDEVDFKTSLPGAQVNIFEDGVLWESLQEVMDTAFPHFISTRYPVAGRTYRIEVSAPGYTPVSGEDRIPTAVPIQSLLRRDSVRGNDLEATYMELEVAFDDIPGLGDTYEILVIVRDTIEFAPGQFFIFSVPIVVETDDPSLEKDQTSTSFNFSDTGFDGRQRKLRLRINQDEALPGRTSVVLARVSDHYFRYKRTMSDFIINDFNPFAEPTIIYSNMTPGMGIFAGYSASYMLVPQ
jgi:hypothetical protein